MLDAAAMLATGAGRRQVAEHFGIPYGTLSRWCQRPDFARLIVGERKAIVRVALDDLAAASKRAVGVLIEIAEDREAPAAARVNAANSILDRVLPPPVHEGVIVADEPSPVDYSALPAEDLETLAAIMRKAATSNG